MAEAPPSDHSAGFVAAGLTDVGRQRRHNEDHILVKHELALFAVSDGMGGHNAGDVASKLATTSLCNFFEATTDGKLPPAGPNDDTRLAGQARRLAAGVRKANHDVFEISCTYHQHSGMGSTIVAIHLEPEQGLIHIAHVGDSRCYRMRAGKIELLTRDHSLVNDAIDLKPDLSEDELARLPRNIITRALGMKEAVKVDIRTEATRPGDVYLLCSDGLSGMVLDEQILEVFEITDDVHEACELLIAMANDAGGSDNISAIAVRVEKGEESEERDHGDQRNRRGEVERTPRPSAIVAQRASDGGADRQSNAEIHRAEAVSRVSGIEPPRSAERRTDPPPRLSDVEIARRRNTPFGNPLEALQGKVAPGVVELLSAGAEVDLNADTLMTIPEEVRVARCKACNSELFVGNLFCVECGAPID